MADEKKTVTVSERVRELVYDIRNKTHLTGESREADGTKSYESASNIQASDESAGDYQIRRSLSAAFSTLKSLVSEYLTEERSTSDNLLNEEIDNDGTLTLTFELPGNYNPAAAESLADGIHSYLVDTALGEWFSITAKEEAEAYIARSAANLETIRRALYKRVRPTRPTY